jgi:hypothetical protein
MDYRCEDGRFPVSPSCMTLSNQDLHFNSETGASPVTKSWKKHSSEWARCQEAVGGIH